MFRAGDNAIAVFRPRYRFVNHQFGDLPQVPSILSVQGNRPAGIAEAAADRIEADHVGTELRERHSAQRQSAEGGTFDDPHAAQNAAHTLSDAGPAGYKGKPPDGLVSKTH